MVSDRGDRGLFSIWTCSFWLKCLISFPLVITTWIGDYFEIRWCGANCSVRFSYFLMFFCCWIFHYFIQLCITGCGPSHSTVSTTALAVRRSNHSARSDPHIILFLYLFMCIRRTCSPRKWRCRSNSERKLWTRFEFADFFCSGRVVPNIRSANKLARYK